MALKSSVFRPLSPVLFTRHLAGEMTRHPELFDFVKEGDCMLLVWKGAPLAGECVRLAPGYASRFAIYRTTIQGQCKCRLPEGGDLWVPARDLRGVVCEVRLPPTFLYAA